MNKILTLSLAVFGLALSAAADQQSEPAPQPDHDERIVRNVTVLKESNAPYVIPVQRGYFGLSSLDLTSDLLRHFKIDADGGVLISSVAEDGPAAKAGIRVGDVLVEVDGDPVESRFDAAVVIGRLEPASKVYAKVFRNGRPQTVEVTVGEHKRGQVPLNWVVETHNAPNAHAYQFHFKPDSGTDEFVVVNPDELRESVEKMRERLHSPEYTARIEAFRERNADLEVRLQEMERRLEEMGERLAAALAEIHSQATGN